MIYFDTIRLHGLSVINLPILGGSSSEPYLVSAVDGLGPPDLDVVMKGDRADRKAQGREIVIRAGLNPDYKMGQTVPDLRYALYGLLSPNSDPDNQSVKVSLVRDNVPVVETTGYVKRIEIVPFNKKPEVQVIISCVSSYFTAPEAVNLTRDILGQSYVNIFNEGLAPTGVRFELEFIRPSDDFHIWVENGSSMKFSHKFLQGDELVVDTNNTTRFVGLKRGGAFVNYLDVLLPESDWFTLYGGWHAVQFSDASKYTWRSFTYLPRYWGI